MSLAPTDPLAVRLTAAVHSGALGDLARLLDEQPELAKARIAGRRGGWRTPLHVATDWPGYFPNGPAVVRLLVERGASRFLDELLARVRRAGHTATIVIRDLKDQALRHVPSGQFQANSAWTVIAALAHNLGRWATQIGLPNSPCKPAQSRRHLLRIPGRGGCSASAPGSVVE